MPEDVTKRLPIVFGTGLPLGRRGLFTHEGERWIALPQVKYQAVLTVTDRLVGAIAGMQRELTNLIVDHPDDAQRIGRIFAIIARVEQFRQQALTDKTQAWTA